MARFNWSKCRWCIHRMALLLVLLLTNEGVPSVDAIQCYVCAPVPEILETCVNVEDAELEACSVAHEVCHLVVTKQVLPHGKEVVTEVSRGCGRAPNTPPASVPVDGRGCQNHANGSLQVCHCARDSCNAQLVEEPASSSASGSPSTATTAPLTLGTARSPTVQEGREDLPKVTSPLVTTQQSSSASATARTPFLGVTAATVLFLTCLRRR
ncbi:uncharacterized protein LOC129587350 [Paramacrobiotus metropolitanus]|uniref:uncharacterized protein LOC129587350 n=1 Tax=Paramacrobiotus metropolitanus TaxID=2943436 RepID=UPI002445E31C|nr:uncharacterized protein LOC129587350 [Paramacrobiotus metropolitanus]